MIRRVPPQATRRFRTLFKKLMVEMNKKSQWLEREK